MLFNSNIFSENDYTNGRQISFSEGYIDGTTCKSDYSNDIISNRCYTVCLRESRGRCR